ncbi:MAG: hypothetical protein K6B46_06960 [Opitutales bacterium]|nr:hypothetical protein [Opitutales bacterium]
MYKFAKFILPLSILPAGTLFGATVIKGDGITTYFAPGVSFESGWHDADKDWNAETQSWNGDGEMCWASQASCMAAYWQDWYVKAGNSLGANVPKTASEIFNTYKANWTNKGGLSEFGLPWYFTGQMPQNYYTNLYNFPNSWSQKKGSGGAYFKELYPNPASFVAGTLFTLHNNFDGDGVGGLQQSEFTEILKDLICNQDCVIGLSLEFWGNTAAGQEGGLYSGHAVTLWGFDVNDATGLVTAVHITDSDDKHYGLTTYSVGNGYYGYDTEFPDYLGENVRDKYWTLTHSFYSLSVKDFADLVVVPEPSLFAFFAGTLALLLAGTRRRRA